MKNLSRDHKPTEDDERDRIMRAGGRLGFLKDDQGLDIGPLRIFLKNDDVPALAVSRCFGDILGKKLGCIHIPEIWDKKLEMNDKFIVIGSDGLFEYIEHATIVKEVIPFYELKQPTMCVRKLIDLLQFSQFFHVEAG